MQFIKNSSQSKSNVMLKMILKILAVFALIFVLIIFFNKIDFPAPLKEIEKKIPNENLKIVK